MLMYTCKAHPGLPAHHSNDCDAPGVRWCDVELPPTVTIQTLQAAIKSIHEDEDDFRAYMTAELARFKCCHEDGEHASTPPMFWPELIRCIIKRAVLDDRAKREAKP